MKTVLTLLVLLRLPAVSQTEFSLEHAAHVLRHLVLDIGPRPMGSPAEHSALEYAVSAFKESGCDTAYIMPFDRSSRENTRSGIAVGIKRGASKRIILIGGHIDSAGPEVPGADDDGSGAAIVIELARVFGRRAMRSTLVFCCFGGEERGLEGSKYFAGSFGEIDSVDLMLQADMANGLGTIDLDPDTHGASAPRWLVRAAVEEFYGLGYDHLRYPTHFFSLNYAFSRGAGSDHESFLERGIPAVDFSSDVDKPIHTPRDNLENFDPAGLGRSGDLFARLITRFDGTVPARRDGEDPTGAGGTEQYWLYLVLHTPIFIPLWMIRAFVGLTVALAIIAFVSVRKRREPTDSPRRIRWSGMKIYLASALIAAAGWLSSDLIALIRGIRHPWLTAIPLYYMLGAATMMIAGWASIRILRKLKLSQCPYVYFKRAVILLTLFTLGLGILSVKLAVEPGAALALITLSALVRGPLVKLCLMALSPWWMLRLVFSEWDGVLFRGIASTIPAGPVAWLSFNGLMILFLSVYVLPFLFGLAFVIRDSRELRPLIAFLGSTAALAGSIVAFVAVAGYALAIPVYNELWYRDLRIDERWNSGTHSRELALRSSEYLRGVEIAHGNSDTSIGASVSAVDLEPGPGFDTTWLKVGRSQHRRQSGDTAYYEVELRVTAHRPPLAVSVSYSLGGKQLRTFDTPYLFHTNRGVTRIDWYSFPDSDLTIPVRFSIAGHDTVKETIEVTFDKLADPVVAKGDKIYVIPRTVCVSNSAYGG